MKKGIFAFISLSRLMTSFSVLDLLLLLTFHSRLGNMSESSESSGFADTALATLRLSRCKSFATTLSYVGLSCNCPLGTSGDFFFDRFYFAFALFFLVSGLC